MTMDMQKDLRKMLDTIYEAEALIEMALRRKQNSSTETVKRLVADKCRQMMSIADSWQLTDAIPEPSDSADNRCYDASTARTIAPDDPDAADDIALAENEMLEIVAMASVTPEADDETCKEPTPQELELETPELDPEVEETATEAKIDPPAGFDAHDAPQILVNPPHEVEFVEESDMAGEENDDTDVDVDDDDADADVDEEADEPQDEDITLQNRRERAPLLSFFTINDRFRFRRSLFEGSNPRLLESLAVIESLDSLQQACDYMADDLQWDMESPEVKLFCKIIDRYFKS